MKSILKKCCIYLVVALIIGAISSIQYTSCKSYKSKTYKIGQTIKMKNLSFKVNSVKTSMGTEYLKPKAGNKYVYINTTVENKGKKQEAISSMLMFKLVDKNGTSQDQSIVDNANGQLDGDLGAGRKMTGDLVYETKISNKSLELEITPYIGSKLAVVSIPIK